MSSSTASSSSTRAAACSMRRSSESATAMFEPSSFCSTSSMSSGETTLSGSSRLRSSNVRYFLSPPNSSRRCITSSRSFSSMLMVILICDWQSADRPPIKNPEFSSAARAWEKGAASPGPFQVLQGQPVSALHVAGPLGCCNLNAEFVDPAVGGHQPEGDQAALRAHEQVVHRLALLALRLTHQE